MKRLLRPLAAGFGMGVSLRREGYRRGWFKTRRLARPVVSVGNLTVGGTGKTPMVAYLAERLLKRGLRPAILTRGYGRQRGAKLVALDPGPDRAPNPREVGDEAALLARKLPDVPIVISADRFRAGHLAEQRFDVDVHLLDDGFQHLALARDLDIVLLDVTQALFDDALLPAGRLREPPAALGRAQMIVLTRIELGDPTLLEEKIRRINPQAKVFHCATKLRSIVDLGTGRIYPPGAFQGEPIAGFCGIGNPRAFFADLRRWGFSIASEHKFRDHCIYTPLELEMMSLFFAAKEADVAAFITTEKDAMNMPELAKRGMPILACVIESEILEAEAFEEAVMARSGAGVNVA